MNVRASFESDAQLAMLMHPRMRSLDDPAIHAESASVSLSTSSDHWPNASQLQRQSMRERIVGAIGIEAVRSVTRMPNSASNRRNGVNQRDELRHVVGVGGCQGDGQWASVMT